MNLIQIENRFGKVSLNDTVNKESADRLLEEIGRLYGAKAVLAEMRIGEVVCNADDALTSLELEINSPGGSVFEGQRIYSALREASMRGVNVITAVNGLAASMGSVVLMAGDERKMTKVSRIMIHEASTMAHGDAASMQRTANLLEGISSDIAGIYAERSGQDKETMRDLMKSETWMDAEKALQYGFVHSVENYTVDKFAKNNNTSDMTFLTSKAALEKIKSLEDRNSDLEAELVVKDEAIESLQSEIKNKDADLSEKAFEIDNLKTENAKIATLEAELTAEKAKSEEAKNSAGAQAIEALAALGQPVALEIESSEANGSPEAITREAFNALDHIARNDYVRKGGKIK